jgi:hypothetical protein
MNDAVKSTAGSTAWFASVVDKIEDQNLEDYNRGHWSNSRRILRVTSHDTPEAVQTNLIVPTCSIY